MGFDSIVGRVNSLPPLPQSVQKIQALYAQGEPDMRELVKIVESDPVLTADILAKVNAPIYSFSKNIVSVLQAATLFGQVPLRGFVLVSSASKAFEINMKPYGITNEQFQNVCNLQSALMFQWYMGVDIELAKVLVPIAFLMEMGKVVIAKEVGESEYEAMFADEIAQSANVAETEKFYADMSSAEVNALLFEHWHFNELFINAMRYLDDPINCPPEYRALVEALDVVRTCVNIKTSMSEQSIKAAEAKVSKYGMAAERFVHTAQRLKRRYEEAT